MSHEKTIKDFSQLVLDISDQSPATMIKKQHQKWLKIYQRNYLFTLLKVLANYYQATQKILGENNFKFFGREFIKANPSQSSNLDDYGSGFADFLASREEIQKFSPLPQIARLDYFWFAQANLCGTLKLPRGSFDYWQAIQQSKDLRALTIDFNQSEVLSIETNGEDYLLLRRDELPVPI